MTALHARLAATYPPGRSPGAARLGCWQSSRRSAAGHPLAAPESSPQAGGLLLTRTLRVTGLDRGLDAALERWRPGRAVHAPGKIITDLAVAGTHINYAASSTGVTAPPESFAVVISPQQTVHRAAARVSGTRLCLVPQLTGIGRSTIDRILAAAAPAGAINGPSGGVNDH